MGKTKGEGRPTKFTKATQDRICALLRGGNTRRAVARASGISHETFYEWLESKPDFSDAVERAESEAEILMVESVRKAARGYEAIETETITLPDGSKRQVEKRKHVFKPEMALEWLKRRRRDEWGDNVRIDVDDEITKLLAALATGSKDSPS